MTDLRNHPDLTKAPFFTGLSNPPDPEVRLTFGPGFTVDHVDFREPEQPVTYLQGDEDGSVWLVCEAAGCMVAGSCYDRLCFLHIELPFRCSPWQAAGALTAHLREAHR